MQPKPCYRDKLGNYYDERGLLLPFLAGVVVASPFAFLAGKNNPNNQQQYMYPPQAPVYYPMYQQQPFMPYPMYR